MKQCIEPPEPDSLQDQLWSEQRLSDYINFIQKFFEPQVSLDAEMIVNSYYQFLRQNTRVQKDRKSVRTLESLIRLS